MDSYRELIGSNPGEKLWLQLGLQSKESLNAIINIPGQILKDKVNNWEYLAYISSYTHTYHEKLHQSLNTVLSKTMNRKL